MSEMVERVARALVVSKFGPEAEILFDSVPREFRDADKAQDMFTKRVAEARRDARAAIEAMREPTDEMVHAGNCAKFNAFNPTANSFRAMIDAALDTSPKQGNEQ